MSSPGAGKTSLLERTIRELGAEIPICVVEGDQETTLDAERIGATGCRAVQINTGSGCHLDAAMIADALKRLKPPSGSVLMIENVGNLVCPALFDLGESARIVIASVTEGEDKPLKYPHMFRAADVMILNKIDLLPYVPFNVDRCIGYARQINPALKVLQVSVLKGDGMDEWYSFLREKKSRSGRAGALGSRAEQNPELGSRAGAKFDAAADLTGEREHELHPQGFGFAKIDVSGEADAVIGDNQL